MAETNNQYAADDSEAMAGKEDITRGNDEVKRKPIGYNKLVEVDLEHKSTESGFTVDHNLLPGMKDTNEETPSLEEAQIELKMASRSLLPTAIGMGTMQNILILGTARAGKYTIAKHIATDNQDFPSQDSEKGIGVVHRYPYHNYKFIIIDTGGAHSKNVANEKPSIDYVTIERDIEAYLEHGINLILLVIRRDCCAPEELTFLANVVEALFTKAAREYIALVHSGCENFEDDQCKGYIDAFKRSEGPAGRLTLLCRKGICAVGFPDLEQTNEIYFHLYQESIKNSKAKIRKLVNDSKTIQPHSELFNVKRHSVMGYKCVLM